MIIAFTGHTNIEKALGRQLDGSGESYNENSFNQIVYDISMVIQNYCEIKKIDPKSITIVSGMARGVDEAAAFYAIWNNLPLILSIPNSVSWHKTRPLSRGIHAQAISYDVILAYDKLTIYEIKKDYGQGHPFANFARNQHMVDISDAILSYKKYDSTGTDHCIKAAKKKGNYLGNIPTILHK